MKLLLLPVSALLDDLPALHDVDALRGLKRLHHHMALAEPLRDEAVRHAYLVRGLQIRKEGDGAEDLCPGNDAHLLELLLPDGREDVLVAEGDCLHLRGCPHRSQARHVIHHRQFSEECTLPELRLDDLPSVDDLDGVADALLDDEELVANLALRDDVRAAREGHRLQHAYKQVLLRLRQHVQGEQRYPRDVLPLLVEGGHDQRLWQPQEFDVRERDQCILRPSFLAHQALGAEVHAREHVLRRIDLVPEVFLHCSRILIVLHHLPRLQDKHRINVRAFGKDDVPLREMHLLRAPLDWLEEGIR
mmetsp:Transcript_106179/g.338160  ORF Transcript_106179/g.338160 Transcript_106179/m.338160 type:complete len:304 (+) Transcript_106179:585-1496(+)